MELLKLLTSLDLMNNLAFLAVDFSGVISATAVVGGTGIIIGILLGIAAKKFEVEVDEREVIILDLLPGANCGACGYPGCDGCAAAIASGKAPADACTVASSDVHVRIADVIGSQVEESVKKVAFVMCAGTDDKARNKLNYYGIKDCREAAHTPGAGPKQCNYGCMGFGSCVRVCKFDAIHIVDGIALVDKEKCTACGMCVTECPKNIIELVPYEDTGHLVRCHSNDKGKDVKAACDIGCIGCKLCEKACQYDAVHVNDFLAKIDYEKCVNCGECAKKCPTKVILSEFVNQDKVMMA